MTGSELFGNVSEVWYIDRTVRIDTLYTVVKNGTSCF